MTSIYFISGAILVGIFFCGCVMGATDISKEQQALKEQKSLDKAKLEEIRKAYLELRYDDRKKEGEFRRYFYKRESGKLTYIVPEFEKRIIKINKLKYKARKLK